MLELKILNINRNSPSHLDVSWEFKDTLENLSDYKIDLYRSEAPSINMDDYDLVDSGLELSLANYVDSGVDGLRTHDRDWYYRIKLTYVPSGEESYLPTDSYAYINDDYPNRKWLKILKHKKWALKKDKAGKEFILLKKRTWGERCEVSWDSTLFKRNSSVCDDCDCWGTGWREGFFKPIKFRGTKRVTPKQRDIMMWGEFYPSDSVLYTLPTPVLTNGDVIVDLKTDKRYHIQRVRTVEMLGVPVEQQAQISLAHVDDEIYEYNVEAYK